MGFTFWLNEGLVNGVKELFSVVVSRDQETLEAQRFHIKVPDGCLCLIGCYFDFWYTVAEYQLMQNDPAFNPAAVVNAIVSMANHRKQLVKLA